MKKTNLLGIVSLFLCSYVFAQEPDCYRNHSCTKLKMSGYIDGSYNYLVNSNRFTSGIYDRVFDINENGLTLQQASLTLAYQPKQGLGALINPIVGRDTYIFSPYGWNPDYGSQWVGFALPQAFVQYAMNSFTVSGGNHIQITGADSLAPINDYNFSRSILYGYAEPITVTGLRTSYVPNDKVSYILGVNNGWDNIRDWSRQKTLELGFAYTVNKIFSFSVQGYRGQERATPFTDVGPKGIRSLIDFIATIHSTEKLSFIMNYDYGWQTKAMLPGGNLAEAVWNGICGYVNYKLNEKWLTSVRGEIFSDRNGFRTGVPQTWKEATLSLGYLPIKDFELRAETRHDFSNKASFTSKNNLRRSQNQQSFALEGFYKFG